MKPPRWTGKSIRLSKIPACKYCVRSDPAVRSWNEAVSGDRSGSQRHSKSMAKLSSSRRRDHLEGRKLPRNNDRKQRKLSLQAHTFTAPQQRALLRHAVKSAISSPSPTQQKRRTTCNACSQPKKLESGAPFARLPAPPVTSLVRAITFKPRAQGHQADQGHFELTTNDKGEEFPLVLINPETHDISPPVTSPSPTSSSPSTSPPPQRPSPRPLTHQGQQHHAFTEPALSSHPYIDELKTPFLASPGSNRKRSRPSDDEALFLPSNAARLRSSAVGAMSAKKRREQPRERLFFPSTRIRKEARGEKPPWRA